MAVQSNYKTTTTASLGNTAATDLDIYLDVLPNSSTGYLVLDPLGSNYEIIYYESKDAGAGMVTCPAVDGRGLSLTATTKTYVAGNQKNHGAGTTVIMAPDHYTLNAFDTDKLDTDGSNAAAGFDLQVAGTDVRVRNDGGELKFTDGVTAETSLADLAAAAGTDTKVKVSINDTTAGLVEDKFVAGTNTTIATNNDGGNETFQYNASGTLAGIVTDVTATSAEINQALDGIGASVTAAALTATTAGAASNADAFHSHSSPSLSFTAGEAINGSADAIPLGMSVGGKDSIMIADTDGFADDGAGTADTWRDFGNADNTYKVSQAFTYTNPYMSEIKISKVIVAMSKAANPVDNVTIEIQEDNGAGVPNGTVYANGTSGVINGADLTATVNRFDFETFTFSTDPTINSGDTFHVVVRRSGAIDAVNYYRILRYDGDKYSGHSRSLFTLSTGTWGSTITTDLAIYVEFTLTSDGKVYPLDANNLDILNYVGWTKDNVAEDAAIDVIIAGEVDTVAGLTVGKTVYASTTAGDYAHSVPAVSNAVIPLGIATATDKLLIRPGGISLGRDSSTLGGADHQTSVINTNNGVANSASIFIKTGFQPRRILAHTRRVTGSGLASFYNQTINDGHKMSSDIVSTNGSNQYVTAATSHAFDTYTGGVSATIVENGFYYSAAGINLGGQFGTELESFNAQA